MKKIIFTLVGVLVLASSLWLAQDKTRKIDVDKTVSPTSFSAFKHKIGKEALMIEFGSVSCHSCQIMGNILFKIKQEHPQSNIYFIDIYKDKKIARKFGVRVIPTQKYLDSHGDVIDTHMGIIEKTELEMKLKNLGVIK